MPAPTWREKVKRNWINMRLGHEAMMMDKLQKQGALVERLVRKAQDGSLGTSTDEPEEADSMGVMVGNEIHNHYGPEPTEASPSVSPGADTDVGLAEVPAWKKAAALAAIVAGMGGTAGLASYLTSRGQDTPPAVTQPPDVPGYGVVVEKQVTPDRQTEWLLGRPMRAGGT